MTQYLLFTSKKPFSVSFASPADTGRVVDGKVLRQSVLYEPNLPRTQSLTEFASVFSVTSVAKLPKLTLLSVFTEQLFSNTRLDQVNQAAQFAKSTKMNVIMQNKPNLCVFWAVSGDCEEKQTQTNPIQTQNKAIFRTKNLPQTQNKPKQTQPVPAKAPDPVVVLKLVTFLPHSCGLRHSKPPAELRNLARQKKIKTNSLKLTKQKHPQKEKEMTLKTKIPRLRNAIYDMQKKRMCQNARKRIISVPRTSMRGRGTASSFGTAGARDGYV